MVELLDLISQIEISRAVLVLERVAGCTTTTTNCRYNNCYYHQHYHYPYF